MINLHHQVAFTGEIPLLSLSLSVSLTHVHVLSLSLSLSLSLTLFLYLSLLLLSPGRSSKLHPMSTQRWYLHVTDDRITPTHQYVRVQKRTSLVNCSFFSCGALHQYLQKLLMLGMLYTHDNHNDINPTVHIHYIFNYKTQRNTIQANTSGLWGSHTNGSSTRGEKHNS